MINVMAPINSLSYGLVGLNFLLELERQGKAPALWPIGQVEADPDHHQAIQAAIGRTVDFKRNLPCLRVWHQFAMAESIGKGPRIGYTIFELNRLRPVEKAHLNSLDLVIVPSAWASSVLQSEGIPAERIRVVPIGFDPLLFAPQEDRSDGPVTFLNVGKWEIRKGANTLREAFERAFSPEDDVRLIMHCPNPFLKVHEQREWEDYYQDGPMRGKIEARPTRLPLHRDMVGLYQRADVGVFPSRAEGWNMPLAEMMAMGKPCIATRYSGHTEFAHGNNCHLIDVDRLQPAKDGHWFGEEPHQMQGEWAYLGEAQLESLVFLMRKLYREVKEKKFSLAPKDISQSMQRFTWENCTKKLWEAIQSCPC